MIRKQYRNLIASAIAVAVLLAAYLALVFTDPAAETSAEGVCVYTVDASTITAIRFSGSGGPVSLVRSETGWIWEEDPAFPLNQNFVDTMLEKTSSLQALRQVARGTDAYAAYGLDTPSNVITVTAADQDRILYLGDTNSATGDCYLAMEGSDIIYTVDSTFPTLFSSSINDMAVRETLPDITTEQITAFTVTQGSHSISFRGTEEDASSAQKRWIVTQDGTAYEADSSLVMALFSEIIQLRYTHMDIYAPTNEQLAECGLDSPAAVLEVSYTQKDGTGETYVLRVGNPTQDGENRYVYTPSGQGIYSVQTDSLESFLQLQAENFLSMDVLPVRPEELSTLHITAPDGTADFELIRSADTVSYLCNGAEISEAEFNSFYFALYALEAEKRVSDISGQLTQTPVVTMEYQLTTGASHVTELVPYDQNYYAARTDGAAVLLVNRTTVNSLLSTLTPYLSQ